MNARAHLVVQGLVQGVGFRYFIARSAARLGLHGAVRNLPNGDVEIEVEGDRGLVEELIKDARVGPREAMVKQCHVEWRPAQNMFTDFEIR